MDQSEYEFLKLDQRAGGVLVVTFDNPSKLNAVTERGHFELVHLWPAVDADPDVRVVLLRGEGRAFSAGGDYEMIENIMNDPSTHRRVLKETRELVRNIIECSKPIVSAINGVAVGAGLAAALLADIPVAARSARILDGHTTIGVTAGDHAAVIWPLLMGVNRAKYYLMTGDRISAEDEFFANGITDAITARLASLGRLGVISRTSAMQFRDSDLSSREIGAQLNRMLGDN